MEVNLNLPSKEVAKELCKGIVGEPTENRVMIISPKESERKTNSGLYVPDTVKEGVPRKGVIVKFGPITSEYNTYQHQLKIGSIVTYGLYAGKEIDPTFIDQKLKSTFKDHTFTILSMNELIYVE